MVGSIETGYLTANGNSSVGYKTKKWEVRLSGKNLTNERYFTGNGTNIVLVTPAIGRTLEGKYTYKF